MPNGKHKSAARYLAVAALIDIVPRGIAQRDGVIWDGLS